MSAITQKIVLDIEGGQKVNATLRVTQQELVKVGAAGKTADAGMKAAEAGSKSLGQAFSAVTSGVGKLTFGVTAFSSVLGLALGGGLSGALGGLLTAFKGLYNIISDTEGETKRAAKAADEHADALKRTAENAKAAAEAMREFTERRLAQSSATESAFAGGVGADLSSFTLAGRLDLRAQGRSRARTTEAMEELVKKAETATAAQMTDIMDRYEELQRILAREDARLAVPGQPKPAAGGRGRSKPTPSFDTGPDWNGRAAYMAHGADVQAKFDAERGDESGLGMLVGTFDDITTSVSSAAQALGEFMVIGEEARSAAAAWGETMTAHGAAVASGLAQAAVSALLYGESIGKALKKVIAATAAASLVDAAREVALGIGASFWNPPAAAAHFASAKAHLAVGAVAGVAAAGLGGFGGGGGGGGGSGGGGGGGGKLGSGDNFRSQARQAPDAPSTVIFQINGVVNAREAVSSMNRMLIDGKYQRGIRQAIQGAR